MPSLLIVEDEDDIRFLVRRMAEQAGWTVAGEAASGEEALELWTTLRADVMVVDHRLPGLSGLDVAQRILADDAEQAIVLFTAFHDSGLEVAAFKVGVRACIPKSELHRLLPELRACVGKDAEPEPPRSRP